MGNRRKIDATINQADELAPHRHATRQPGRADAASAQRPASTWPWPAPRRGEAGGPGSLPSTPSIARSSNWATLMSRRTDAVERRQAPQQHEVVAPVGGGVPSAAYRRATNDNTQQPRIAVRVRTHRAQPVSLKVWQAGSALMSPLAARSAPAPDPASPRGHAAADERPCAAPTSAPRRASA